MSRKSLSDMSELLKTIMEEVWEMGEVNARQVQARLEKHKQKRYAYNTVATLMKRLEDRGWLKHRIEGRTFIYQAAASRDQEAIRSSKRLIDRAFHGNTRLLFQQLIEEEDLSDEDLLEIRKMIDKKRRSKKS
ncbi:MAG: BlaI/MecI/CopY family transcriptional regulator [Candidatus Hinthialibacter sp.]